MSCPGRKVNFIRPGSATGMQQLRVDSCMGEGSFEGMQLHTCSKLTRKRGVVGDRQSVVSPLPLDLYKCTDLESMLVSLHK